MVRTSQYEEMLAVVRSGMDVCFRDSPSTPSKINIYVVMAENAHIDIKSLEYLQSTFRAKLEWIGTNPEKRLEVKLSIMG